MAARALRSSSMSPAYVVSRHARVRAACWALRERRWSNKRSRGALSEAQTTRRPRTGGGDMTTGGAANETAESPYDRALHLACGRGALQQRAQVKRRVVEKSKFPSRSATCRANWRRPIFPFFSRVWQSYARLWTGLAAGGRESSQTLPTDISLTALFNGCLNRHASGSTVRSARDIERDRIVRKQSSEETQI